MTSATVNYANKKSVHTTTIELANGATKKDDTRTKAASNKDTRRHVKKNNTAAAPTRRSTRLAQRTTQISKLLPQLQRLKTLRLVIPGSGSVFPAIGKVKTLQSFVFESDSYPLTDHDLSYMKSLEHLESLQFHNGQQRSLFNHKRGSPEILASVLGSLPKLQTLEI